MGLPVGKGGEFITTGCKIGTVWVGAVNVAEATGHLRTTHYNLLRRNRATPAALGGGGGSGGVELKAKATRLNTNGTQALSITQSFFRQNNSLKWTFLD